MDLYVRMFEYVMCDLHICIYTIKHCFNMVQLLITFTVIFTSSIDTDDSNDAQRPSALVSLYSNVYKNEWKHAYDVLKLQAVQDRNAIECLLFILLVQRTFFLYTFI